MTTPRDCKPTLLRSNKVAGKADRAKPTENTKFNLRAFEIAADSGNHQGMMTAAAS
jgi:hypothetical protein